MKFIDFFSGIGGMRLGLEQAGLECAGYVEFDKYARLSYQAMHDTEGEWTAEDIRDVEPEDIPPVDLWAFGFPCQDVSVAGLRKGLKGERSRLFFEIIRLIKGKSPEDRPEWILCENVKNLFSIDGGRGFTEVLFEISEAGYDAEWHLVNSKDHGVPQNRERVFVIGHLRDRGSGILFLESGEDRQASTVGEGTKEKLERVLGSESQSKRIYNADGLARAITGGAGGMGAKTGYYAVEKKTAIPFLTPDRIKKGQNGRRFKENGDPSYTLTAQDKHGIIVEARPMLRANKSVHKPQGPRIKSDSDPMFTLTSCDVHGALLSPSENTHGVFKYDGHEYNIRKLTPKECFRLQGFPDSLFEKARKLCSDNQLYKQAGNAVTVNVGRLMGERILFLDKEKKRR